MAHRRAVKRAPSTKKAIRTSGAPEAGSPHSPDTERGAAEAGAAPQHLTFFLAGEEYGIGILRAREILEYEALTRVPTMPPWVRGVMNLRGNVVPVVDLALKLGLAETEVTGRTCIIIVEVDLDAESTVMGILADAVNQVIALQSDQVEEPPAFGTRVDAGFLAGMGKLEGRFVLILDVDRALSVDELLSAPLSPESAGPTERIEVSGSP
jgi:purine-binding chemotaxis protein CheW